MVLFVIGLLAGCNNGVVTDGGQLALVPDGIVADPISGMTRESPVLEGTRVCAKVRCEGRACPEPREDAADCFDQSLDGSAYFDGDGCVVFDAPGDVTWQFEPRSCLANDDGYDPAPDAVTLTTVPRDEVFVTLPQWVEDLAEQGLEPASGSFPGDWRNPPGEPWRVVDGGTVRFVVTVRHPDHDAWVAWSMDDARVVVESLSGPPVDVFFEDGWVELTVPEGARASIGLEGWGRRLEAGQVVGVAADAPASLQLVAGYLPEEEGRKPFGARAVLRDAAGHPLYGAPVRWGVAEGQLAVSAGDVLPGPDYASFDDACIAPEDRGGLRRVEVTARYGDLHDAATLTWTGQAGQVEDDWRPSTDCLGEGRGCGCQVSPLLPASVASLGLLGVAALRRRRP